MADENKATLILDGDGSPLKKTFREATEAVHKFGSDAENSVKKVIGPLESLQSKFIAISGILAGGKVFKEAVDKASKFTEESMKLGNALGSSATQASTFIAALEDIDLSQEEFVTASRGMLKELKNNETGLQAMGLKTRDAAGGLRPLNQLMIEGIEVVNSYKAGTDRAIAGQAMFGKGFDATGNLLKLNSEALAENAELQERLGILVGQENVEAWKEFDSAGDKAGLTLKALWVTVGNSVMPVLTDLANWFAALGPAAVVIIRGALGGLVATFHLVTTGVTVLWETLNAMVVSVAEPIRALGEALSRALKGDWAGAKESVAAIGSNISGAWGKAFDEMATKAQGTRDRIYNLFANSTPADMPGTDGKSAEGLLTEKKDKKEKSSAEKSQMSYYEAALAKQKELYSQENALREFSKAQELAYWESILRSANLTANDRLAIEKKVSSLTVDVRRQEAQQKRDIDTENTRSAQELALGRVDIEQAAMEAMLGAEQITQMQALAMEQGFEAKRYEIKRAALMEKLALYEADPELNPVEMARIKNQLLELEQQYLLKKTQMQGKFLQHQKLEMKKSDQMWESLGQSVASLWDKGLDAMMNGTLRWRNALRAIWTELAGWFGKSVVWPIVKEWALGKAAEFAISQGWLTKEQAVRMGMMGQELMAKQTTATASMSITAQEAMVGIGNKGASAAAGAADSVASIPFVGPMMAAAAFAATLAMVLGARSGVKSARGGFDIPAGLNPLTQLHEQEMVLPAEHANVIRNMAANGGGGGGGNTTIINAMDCKSFENFVKTNSRALAPGMRRLSRNFSPKSISSPLGRNY